MQMSRFKAEKKRRVKENVSKRSSENRAGVEEKKKANLDHFVHIHLKSLFLATEFGSTLTPKSCWFEALELENVRTLEINTAASNQWFEKEAWTTVQRLTSNANVNNIILASSLSWSTE